MYFMPVLFIKLQCQLYIIRVMSDFIKASRYKLGKGSFKKDRKDVNKAIQLEDSLSNSCLLTKQLHKP